METYVHIIYVHTHSLYIYKCVVIFYLPRAYVYTSILYYIIEMSQSHIRAVDERRGKDNAARQISQ